MVTHLLNLALKEISMDAPLYNCHNAWHTVIARINQLDNQRFILHANSFLSHVDGQIYILAHMLRECHCGGASTFFNLMHRVSSMDALRGRVELILNKIAELNTPQTCLHRTGVREAPETIIRNYAIQETVAVPQLLIVLRAALQLSDHRLIKSVCDKLLHVMRVQECDVTPNNYTTVQQLSDLGICYPNEYLFHTFSALIRERQLWIVCVLAGGEFSEKTTQVLEASLSRETDPQIVNLAMAYYWRACRIEFMRRHLKAHPSSFIQLLHIAQQLLSSNLRHSLIVRPIEILQRLIHVSLEENSGIDGKQFIERLKREFPQYFLRLSS